MGFIVKQAIEYYNQEKFDHLKNCYDNQGNTN